MITGVDDGVPWVVEAAFAYLPDGRTRQLICGVNWSPALDTDGEPFRLGFQLGDTYCGSDEPILILAHLICPRPEFVDRGKRSLARHSPGFSAIRAAVEAVTADWAKQRKSEIRNKALEQKRQEKMRVEKPRARAVTQRSRAEAPAGSHQADQRRRPAELHSTRRVLCAPPNRPAGAREVSQLWLLHGADHRLREPARRDPGMQREPRGTLYHPHLRQEIPLSTESVARYARPFWTFNKLVYIEKAGTQQNLIEVGWPEEHDCAIASVAGFTTRAIKDLLDMLATSTEPVTVFCVHDADAAGTMIYHTLLNETKARGARKIEVVNLGLEPWEGVEMGLEIEPVEGGAIGAAPSRPTSPSTMQNGGAG